MRNMNRKLDKIEQNIRPVEELRFLAWLGTPWTEEEKAEALRKFPDRKIHIKPLSQSIPIEEAPPL